MNRPLTRPAKPYTAQQICTMVYDHFVIDRSPKCTSGPPDGRCLYSKTGCAVGCMLTKEDADTFDKDTTSGSVQLIAKQFQEIYSAYFLPEHLPMLKALQSAHDSTNNPVDLADRIVLCIQTMKYLRYLGLAEY